MNKIKKIGSGIVVLVVLFILSRNMKGEPVAVTLSGAAVEVGTTTLGELEEQGFSIVQLDKNASSGYSEIDIQGSELDKTSWVDGILVKKEGIPTVHIEMANLTNKSLPLAECIISKLWITALNEGYSQDTEVIINDMNLVGMNGEEIKSGFSDMKMISYSNKNEYTKEKGEYAFNILVEDNIVSEIKVTMTLDKEY